MKIPLSTLMHMSWVFQRESKKSRSKSLTIAWAVFKSQYLLIELLNKPKAPKKTAYSTGANPQLILTQSNSTLNLSPFNI